MISIAATAEAIAERTYAPRVVAVKELTQLANRRRFHLEKSFFAAAVSSVFVLTAFGLHPGSTMSLHELSRLGREAFLSMCGIAGTVLSLTAVGTATGIIMSEVQGRRLDILRATPLSLAGVIAGKALAITAKSALALTLLLPIMAAAYLEGGVGVDEIAEFFALIVSNVFLFTCVGLRVSAGATTMFDRVARPIGYLFIWSFCTSVVTAILSVIPGVRSMAPWMGMSWMTAWGAGAVARLTWSTVLMNAAVHTAGGMIFLWAAAGALRRKIIALDDTPNKLKVKSFMAAKPSRWDTRKRRFARSAAGRVRALAARAGGLVGGQILRTSVMAIVAPFFVVCLAILVCVIWTGFVSIDFAWQQAAEAFYILACIAGAFVAAALGVESCGLIAREKSGHTAEILATTPAGGSSMIWWKGTALFITQALAIAACMAFLVTTGSFVGKLGTAGIFACAGGFAASLMLAFALGVSFSLAVRTPAVAAGLAALTLFVLTPLMMFNVMPALLTSTWAGVPNLASLREATGMTIVPIAALLAIGMAMVVARNLIPVLSAAILCVSVATVLAAGSYLCAWPGQPPPMYVPAAPLVAVVDAKQLAGAFIAIVLQVVTATLLLVGARINFDALFLRGARSVK